MSRNEKLVSIIVVNYNGGETLQRCLTSVFCECEGLDYELIVVDNNSDDGSRSWLAALDDTKVRLVQNQANLGFARANNAAIKVSRGRYLLLLNPDTVILDRAIEKLTDFMEENSHVGAAGCRLLNEDGSLQYSIGNFPTVVNQIAKSFFLHRLAPGVRALNELVMEASAYEHEGVVDWVFGAALIVRRRAVGTVGLLDESFFLFSEEKDWCYRLRAAGWPVYYHPGAHIIHLGRGGDTTPEVFFHLLASKERYFRKHNGFAAHQAYRILIRINLFLRALGWGLAWVVGLGTRSSSSRLSRLYRHALMKTFRRKVGST